jgi:WD40 repeat protein
VQPIAIAPGRKGPVVFDKDVQPILARKCQVCHSGSIREGDLDLASYEGLSRGGRRGKALVPGKSGASLLILLAGKTRKPFMPPKREEPLTPEEFAILRAWVDQGAKSSSAPARREAIRLGNLPSPVHPVRALAISPDNATIAAGRGNEIHLYDARTAKHLRVLTGPQLAASGKPLSIHVSGVEALAYSPDGKMLVSGSFQEVIAWDVGTSTPRWRSHDFAGVVTALAYAPNGKLLAVAGGAPAEDGEVRLLDPISGRTVLELVHPHSDTVFGAAFSPDSTRLATCAADKMVKVFSMPDGRLLKTFEGHTHHVLDVAWKGDGKILASAGADQALKIWDYDRGEPVRTITGHGKAVTRLAFLPNSSVITSCGGDQTVRSWDLESGRELRSSAGGDYPSAMAASRDGARIFVGDESGIVRVFEASTGRQIGELAGGGAK